MSCQGIFLKAEVRLGNIYTEGNLEVKELKLSMAKKYSESFSIEPEARRPNELIIAHISYPQEKGDIRMT